MGGRSWSVGRVADVVSSGRASLRGRDERACLHVLVDPAAPRPLVCAVRDLLMPERANVEVRVLPLHGARPVSDAVDAAVALTAPNSPTDPLRAYVGAGVPVALVVEGALEAPRLELDERTAPLVGVVAASSAQALADKLATWLAAATDKPLALAANLPFCRRAVCDLLVSRCALENAVVGLVRLVPGSDLPLMTANQAKLALDIAAAHGRALEPARALELAGVVGGGLAWRAVARTLVSMLPGLGTLARVGVAYGGTLATGAALRLRFESETGVTPRRDDVDAGPAEPRPQVLLDTSADQDSGYVTIGVTGA